MQGRRPTWREQQEIIEGLSTKVSRLQEQIETLLEGQAYRDKKLAYYENPNTPPSAESMEWKMKKHQMARARERP